MDNREKFMEWFKTPKENQIGGYSRADLYGRSPLAAEAWQACAEQKDKEIAESNRTWKEYVAQVMDDGGKQIRLKVDEVKRLTQEIAELKDLLNKALDERDHFYKLELSRQATMCAKVIK